MSPTPFSFQDLSPVPRSSMVSPYVNSLARLQVRHGSSSNPLARDATYLARITTTYCLYRTSSSSSWVLISTVSSLTTGVKVAVDSSSCSVTTRGKLNTINQTQAMAQAPSTNRRSNQGLYRPPHIYSATPHIHIMAVGSYDSDTYRCGGIVILLLVVRFRIDLLREV